MLLRLILGEAGSGKSHRIREEFLKNTEKRPILIVPEQITLLEQKRLVSEQAGRGLLGADVLSFRRLAHRILAEKGEKDLVVLDEVGKSMLLYRLVPVSYTHLDVYKRQSLRRESRVENR